MALFFAPDNPYLGLWDTWLFPADDVFHLFYLRRDKRDVGCTVIGHAVSSDLVRWEPVRDVLSVSPSPAWDSGALMTGMVVQHHDGRYHMFYGSMVDGVQRIGVALSDDLYTWEKYAGNPVIEPVAPWYETDPLAAPNGETAWRDPCIFYDEGEGAYLAFICARVPGGSYTGGGCIALCRSENLLDWDVHPPVYVSDQHICLEVPDVFQMNGRYYMMYSTAYWFGSYYPTADPNIQNGTFYLQSESLLDGWHEPEGDNILLGSREGRLDSYVGRSVCHNGERLFYHHNVHGTIPNVNAHGSFGSVKRLASDNGGRLTARYYDTFAPFRRPVEPDREQTTLGAGAWQGEGESYTVSADDLTTLLCHSHESVLAEATIQLGEGAASAGLLLGYGAIPDQGLSVWLNEPSQTLDIALLDQQTETLRRAPALHRRRARMTPGEAHHLRVVSHDRYLDIYLDDIFLASFTWDLSPHGRMGLVAGGGHVSFSGVRCYALDLT